MTPYNELGEAIASSGLGRAIDAQPRQGRLRDTPATVDLLVCLPIVAITMQFRAVRPAQHVSIAQMPVACVGDLSSISGM